MNLIAAVCKNNGIGNKNGLLFTIPEDMKFFREMTQNKTVIMGYYTLMSLPNSSPLPNRTNIVLTKKHRVRKEGVIVCKSVETLFKKLKDTPDEEIFVIGGEAIYLLLAPYCKQAFITEIDANPEASKFLSLSPAWKKIKDGAWKEYEGIRFRFCEYANSKPKTDIKR